MKEWRSGWRTLLGCALGGGTGSGLLFLTFSIFSIPLIDALETNPAELAQAQTLIALAAIGSPLAGWAVDRIGFRKVFLPAMVAVIGIELAIAIFVDSVSGLMLCLALLGMFGIATTAVTVTRPVNAWFDANRGLALGLVASGTAIMAIVMPPLLEAITAGWGWRAGFATLATLAAVVGLPGVYFLVRNNPSDLQSQRPIADKQDWSFFRATEFWILVAAITLVNLAQSGFVGQISPMMQLEGLDSRQASICISAFAVGTLIGRLSGGWALDRFPPRYVALVLGIIPASGFFIIWSTDASTQVAIAAAFLIGFQQGAEIDIFAYFTARIFGIQHYGSVYGSLLGISWAGNAAGLIGVGSLRQFSGNFEIAQLVGGFALIISALMFGFLPNSRLHTCCLSRLGTVKNHAL